MGIVNAGQLEVYDEIEPKLRELVEDVLLNRRPDATERLIDHAETVKEQSADAGPAAGRRWRNGTVEERLQHALLKGRHRLHRGRHRRSPRSSTVARWTVIQGPLMDGMSVVGELFGPGKMFLPQVVKSARVMKKAVAYLEPFMEAEKAVQAESGERLALRPGRKPWHRTPASGTVDATVKGDVHDIGKNIVGVVLALQQLRGDRSRRDGAGGEDSGRRRPNREPT